MQAHASRKQFSLVSSSISVVANSRLITSTNTERQEKLLVFLSRVHRYTCYLRIDLLINGILSVKCRNWVVKPVLEITTLGSWLPTPLKLRASLGQHDYYMDRRECHSPVLEQLQSLQTYWTALRQLHVPDQQRFYQNISLHGRYHNAWQVSKT